MNYLYILYDSRYLTNPESATVYTISESLKEAKEDKRDMFPDGVIVRAEDHNNELKNHKILTP